MTQKNSALVELNISVEFDSQDGDNIEDAAMEESKHYIVIDKRTGNPVDTHVEINKSWINI
jgi:hypothetical protein